MDFTIYVVKKKALICAFVFTYAKSRFSDGIAHFFFFKCALYFLILFYKSFLFTSSVAHDKISICSLFLLD